MKGTAGVIGAEQLRAALGEMEQISRRGTLAEAAQSLAHLRQEVSRCIASMPQTRDELKAAASRQA